MTNGNVVDYPYNNFCYAARNAYVNQDLPRWNPTAQFDKYGKFVNYVYDQNSSPPYKTNYIDVGTLNSEEAEKAISNLASKLQNGSNEFAAYVSVVNINPDSNLV